MKTSLKLEEKMKYSLCNPAFTLPNDILFPEEIQRVFKQKIHDLKFESGILMRNYAEKTEQLNNIEKKLSSIGIEGDKKSLGRLENSLRNEINKLRNQVAELQMENNDLKSNLDSIKVRDLAIPDTLLDEVKKYQNKNNQLKNKLMASKNSLKLAQHILKQETGHDFDVSNFQNCQNFQKIHDNWRGRAQTISKLTDKLNELQLKHQNSEEEAAERLMCKKMVEKGQGDVELLQKKNDELQKKLDSKVCRINGLENNVASLKSEISALLEDNLAQESSIQLLQVQKVACDEQKVVNANEKIKTLQNTLKEVQINSSKEQIKLQNIIKTLEERELEIINLKKFIEGKTRMESKYIQCDDDVCERIQKRIEEFQKKLTNEQNDLKMEISRKSQIPRPKFNLSFRTKTISRCSGMSSYSVSREVDELKKNLQLSEEKIQLLEAKVKCNNEETISRLEHLKMDIANIYGKA